MSTVSRATHRPADPPADIAPRLAPPGAGLPWLELRAARVLFWMRRMRGTSSQFDRDIVSERGRVLELVAAGTNTSNSERTLIPRLRGLEDSSRHWSVWMTVEHLEIVNAGVARVLAELIAGRTPPGEASTAAVKPSPTADHAVMARFERSCDALLATVASATTLRTTARYSHPWFGPLDAFGWHAMVSMHMGIHRRQIEAIRHAASVTRAST